MFVVWCAFVWLNALAPVQASAPNIVFILADDYGWNDVGYHGSEIQTPNLDRLANSGVKLENYYVQPQCSPTRSQLLSGRYQIHTGMQHGVINTDEPRGMPLTSQTVADKLREAGYSTHMVGKWHLGFYKNEYLPWNRGFDTFYGYLTGGEDYNTHERCDSITGQPELGEQCGVDFRFNDQIIRNESGHYSTDLFTDRATSIIADHDNSKPLMLYLAYQAVHSPMEAPQNYIDMYSSINDNTRRTYAGMVTCMDDAIARVETALKSKGIWNNTILIFSSDNGGAIHGGGNNWPLRGYKSTLWEGGIRAVGFVASPLLPNRKRGTTNKELIHVSDWFPTMVNLAGGNFNGVLPLDGYDQWLTIRNGRSSPRTELLHNIDELQRQRGETMYNGTFDTRIQAALRMGDMKLLTGDPGDGDWLVVPGNGSDINAGEPPSKNLWLFNITADPNEQHDISETHHETVQSMLDRLAYYESTRVPADNPDRDPNFNPQLHDGAYEPWVL